MYICKHACKNIIRNIGRNALMLILLILIITMSAISMLLHQYAIQSGEYYSSTIGSKVNIIASPQESIDSKTQLSFTTSPLLNKHEKSGYIAVSAKGLQVSDATLDESRIKWLASSKENISEAFDKGEKRIIEGEIYYKDNEVIISNIFAKHNGLKLKDRITLTDKEGKQIILTISGIYQDVSMHGSTNPGGTSLSSHDNEIYTSWKTMEQSDLFPNDLVCTVELYLKHPSDIGKLREELLQKGMPKSYMLSMDLDAFEAKMQPIRQLENSSNKMMYASIIVGGVLLILISIMALQERKYEVGVLRCMGMKKYQIAKSFLYETLIITNVSLVLSLMIASLLGKGLIANISQLQQNMLKISLTFQDALQCFLLALTLGLLSSIAAMCLIMRYEPRRILSEKD